MDGAEDPLAFVQIGFDHPDVTSLTAEVQAYYERIYGGPDDTPLDHREFSPPSGAFFVVYRSGEPLAMGGFRRHGSPLDIPAKCPAEIKRMYVVLRARRQGVARRLLTRLEMAAQSLGADALVLETGLRQPLALALYRAAGYLDIPRFGHYADQPDAVHLGKML